MNIELLDQMREAAPVVVTLRERFGVVARKPRRCSLGRHPIARGDRFDLLVQVVDGELCEFVECHDCLDRLA